VTETHALAMMDRARQLARWLVEVERYNVGRRYLAGVVVGPGCWPWTRGTARGYGAIHVGERTLYAHRVGYELVHGPVLGGKYACHTCDTPLCARPDHVFPGTQRDNLADMARKGRWRNGSTKLTAEQVADIRRRYVAGGVTQKALGDEYGVRDSTICNAIKGVTWRFPR
jgi:hypothetical protein